MSKTLKNQNLSERPATRTFLALSLAASMAAFGCTTDRNVGNGDPVVTPGLRTSPTGGNSAGSESGSVPPPMMSSYSGVQPLPAVRPRIARMSAAEAAALLAEQRQPRVRVLGPASPDSGGRPYVSDAVAYGQPYAGQQTEPRSTVNSSIYSAPTAVITSGAGEAIGSTDAAAATVVATNGAALTGTTAASTVAGSSVGTTVATTTTSSLGTNVTNAGGAVIAPTSAAATPTASAIAAPAAFASVRTLSPTAAAVVNPPASISSSPALATVSSARTAGTTRSTAATTGSTATTGTTTTATSASPTQSGTATANVANPVRVVNSNGRMTITNVTASSTSRQQ
jgi:hypothetical protein